MALDALCRVPQQPDPTYVASVACQLFWACNMCWPYCVAELALVTPLLLLPPLLVRQRVGVARRSGQDRLRPRPLRRHPGQIARLLPVSTGFMLQHVRPEWNPGGAQKRRHAWTP